MNSSAAKQGIDYKELEKALDQASSTEALYGVIVNQPFTFKVETTLMSLGIIVLLLVNHKTRTIDRIALSDNELASRTKHRSAKPFEEIKIPLGHPQNIIARAIETNKPQGTSNWEFLFVPELSAEDARFNQIEGGIGYSAVYPLRGKKVSGALIFSYFQYPDKIDAPQEEFMQRYSQLVAKKLS